MFDRNKSIFFDPEPSPAPPQPERYVQTNAFKLLIQERITRRYGVSIKYYDSGADQPDRRVDYEMQATVMPHAEQVGLWQIALRKEKLLINRQKPDLVCDELAVFLMEALNPICVTVDKWLTIQNGVDNHDELLKSWPAIKLHIRNKYEGETTERLLEKFEQKLSDRGLLFFGMEKDLFWKAFFAPVYGVYNQDLHREKEFSFPLRHKGYAHFQATQTVQQEKTVSDAYKISVSGKSKQQDTIRMNYDLDVDSGLVRHMIVEGFAAEKRFVEFTAYRIGKDHHGEPLIIEVQQEKTRYPKKRGFWGLFR